MRPKLNTLAELKRFIGEDEDFQVKTYSEPETIMCSWEGKGKNIPSGDKVIEYVIRTYITEIELRAKDIIDGQVVLSSFPVKDFRGRISHYESKVGEP